MESSKGNSICDDAEAFALGALEPNEARAFAQHLKHGCARCAVALKDYDAVVEMLALAGGELAPPAAVAAGIMARLGEASQRVPDGQYFVRREERDWVASGFDGIELRSLSTDRERGRRTFMVRMRDGAVLPRHRHEGTEEIFVIEGDLTVSGVEMRAGDYCRAESDSVHDVAVSRGGCVFLVSGSVHDRVLS